MYNFSMKYVEKNKNYKRINNKILEAYNEILLAQGNDNINITDLCKKANINRTTFYKHYKDITDISNELESEFIYNAFSTPEDMDLITFMEKPCASFERLNKNVLENKAFYRIMLRPERLSIFNEKISNHLINDIIKYRPDYNKIYNSKEELKLCVHVTVSYISCAYSMWLRGELKLDIKEVSNALCEVVRSIYLNAKRYNGLTKTCCCDKK